MTRYFVPAILDKFTLAEQRLGALLEYLNQVSGAVADLTELASAELRARADSMSDAGHAFWVDELVITHEPWDYFVCASAIVMAYAVLEDTLACAAEYFQQSQGRQLSYKDLAGPPNYERALKYLSLEIGLAVEPLPEQAKLLALLRQLRNSIAHTEGVVSKRELREKLRRLWPEVVDKDDFLVLNKPLCAEMISAVGGYLQLMRSRAEKLIAHDEEDADQQGDSL